MKESCLYYKNNRSEGAAPKILIEIHHAIHRYLVPKFTSSGSVYNKTK